MGSSVWTGAWGPSRDSQTLLCTGVGDAHQAWLTPYLQAASVVSLSLFFTCGVEVFSRSPRACCVDRPAFSAA